MSNPSTHKQWNKLRCLFSGSPLTQASPTLLNQINQSIKEESLRDNLGRSVQNTLNEALVNKELTFCYPIVDNAIQMLRDEAIPIGQFFQTDKHDESKNDIQEDH